MWWDINIIYQADHLNVTLLQKNVDSILIKFDADLMMRSTISVKLIKY